MGYRQHWHIGFRVFFFSIQRQRPEVRRCPSEDDEHQQQRARLDTVAHRCPTKQRRGSAEDATDDNVLGCRTFQIQRVDQAIAHPRDEVQPGRQRIYEGNENRHAGDASACGEHRGPRERHASGGHRPVLCAPHTRIDMSIGNVIHHRGRCGNECDADQAGDQYHRINPTRCRQHHSHERTQQHEQYHTRLAHLQIVAPCRRPHGDGSHITHFIFGGTEGQTHARERWCRKRR